MSDTQQEEIRRLRSTLQALIRLNGDLWAKLIGKGVLDQRDVSMPASMAELIVLDDQLRAEWESAFRRT